MSLYDIENVVKIDDGYLVDFTIIENDFINKINNIVKKIDFNWKKNNFIRDKLFFNVANKCECTELIFNSVKIPVGLCDPSFFKLNSILETDEIKFRLKFFNQIKIDSNDISSIFDNLNEDATKTNIRNEKEIQWLKNNHFLKNDENPIEKGDFVLIAINTRKIEDKKLIPEWSFSLFPLVVGYETRYYRLNDLLIGKRRNELFSAIVDVTEENGEISYQVKWNVKIINVFKKVKTKDENIKENFFEDSESKTYMFFNLFQNLWNKAKKIYNEKYSSLVLPGIKEFKNNFVKKMFDNFHKKMLLQYNKENEINFENLYLYDTSIDLLNIVDWEKELSKQISENNTKNIKLNFKTFDWFILRILTSKNRESFINDVFNFKNNVASLIKAKKNFKTIITDFLNCAYFVYYAFCIYFNQKDNCLPKSVKDNLSIICFFNLHKFPINKSFIDFLTESLISSSTNNRFYDIKEFIKECFLQNDKNNFLKLNLIISIFERLYKFDPALMSDLILKIIKILCNEMNSLCEKENLNMNNISNLDYLQIIKEILVWWSTEKYKGLSISKIITNNKKIYKEHCQYIKQKIKKILRQVMTLEDNLHDVADKTDLFLSSFSYSIPYYWEQCYTCFEADSLTDKSKCNVYTILQNLEFTTNQKDFIKEMKPIYAEAILINCLLTLFRNIRSNVNNHSGLVRYDNSNNKLFTPIQNKFTFIENRDTFFLKVIFSWLDFFLEKILLVIEHDGNASCQLFIKKWPKKPDIHDLISHDKLLMAKGTFEWNFFMTREFNLPIEHDCYICYLKDELVFSREIDNKNIKKNKEIFPINVDWDIN